MSLRGLVSDALKQAYSQLGDLAVETVFVVVPESSSTNAYDPVTGTVTGTSERSVTVRKTLMTAYKARDIDGTNVQMGDQRILVRDADLKGHVPKTKDVITYNAPAGDPRGGRWHIIKTDVDPTGQLWTLQVRR